MIDANRSFWHSRIAPWALAGCVAVIGLTLTSCSIASDEPGISYEERLATHLTEQGAAMYGAFWCPHCEDQKALFGDAVDSVPYVECAPDGENAQPQLCVDKAIQGYPTWEINGEFYPGARSLEELAQLSGFSSAE
ncbi:MAG: hypothetical protein AAGF98_03455 [Cyanobacteria bacterium P01_H01_bin.153]